MSKKKKGKGESLINSTESLDSNLRFSGNTFVNPFISILLSNQMLTVEQIKEVCKEAKQHYNTFPNILELSVPICVVGDLHGQDEDLMTIFKLNGAPNYDNQYLFLGDYINRGHSSLRIILLMFVLSLEYKSSFFCLRGNHESVEIAKIYGFYMECLKKFGSEDGEVVFNEITHVCNYLPICAIINKKLFCVHGGLSKKVRLLSDIEKIERRINLPAEGILADLLWGDPMKGKGLKASKRGAGYYFGEDVTKRFLKRNKLDKIIRAHQMKKEGFDFCHNNMCITVFSASNYMYKHKNTGAILVIDENGDSEFLQYYANYTPESQEIDVKNISKVKLKMNLSQKRKREYMEKIRQFKSNKERKLRKEILSSLNPSIDSQDTEDPLSSLLTPANLLKADLLEKTPEKKLIKENSFPLPPNSPSTEKGFVDDEEKEEMKLNAMLAKMMKEKGQKHQKEEKTIEEIQKEKTMMKDYLFNFEESIKKKVEESQRELEKEQKKKRIDELEGFIEKLQKDLKAEKEKSLQLQIEVEKLNTKVKQVDLKHVTPAISNEGNEKIKALENLLKQTREQEISSLKEKLDNEMKKSMVMKRKLSTMNALKEKLQHLSARKKTQEKKNISFSFKPKPTRKVYVPREDDSNPYSFIYTPPQKTAQEIQMENRVKILEKSIKGEVDENERKKVEVLNEMEKEAEEIFFHLNQKIMIE